MRRGTDTSTGLRAADKLWRVNWLLLAVVAVLAAVGTTTLYSVAGGASKPWAEAHALRFLAGTALVLAMTLVPLRVWSALAYPVYGGTLLLLVLVPVWGVESMGARRWLSFGDFSLQPAEIMKIGLILGLARYYKDVPPDRVSWPGYVLVPLVLMALPVALTLRQPDLGSAAMFVAVGLAIMFMAGVSTLYFAGTAAIAWLMAPFVWSGLHGYQRRRLEIFMDPDSDPLGAGYHIAQSKIALGSGGLAGRGFMQGTQSQLDFLPEKHTDFIFTMFAEEWGFIGAMVLLAAYAVLLAILLVMALRTGSRFGRLLIVGSAATIYLYLFVNVAMVTGLVPVVGVPLPFVSYGGTAMATLMTGLGLAMAASVDRQGWRGRS